MNVNFKQVFAANRSVTADFDQLQGVDAIKVEQLKAGGLHGPSLVVTDSLPSAAIEMFEHEDYNLVRDDDLGKMVKSAFDLMPPEVPNFV